MIKTIGKRRYKKQAENRAKCTSKLSQNAWSELMRSANMATLASSSGLFGSQAPSQVLKAVILGSYTAHLDLSFSIPQLSCIAANVYLAYKVHLTVRITILLSTICIANISSLCLLQCPSFTGYKRRFPCTTLQGRARVAPRSLHDNNCKKMYPRQNLLALYYVRTRKRQASRLPPLQIRAYTGTQSSTSPYTCAGTFEAGAL